MNRETRACSCGTKAIGPPPPCGAGSDRQCATKHPCSLWSTLPPTPTQPTRAHRRATRGQGGASPSTPYVLTHPPCHPHPHAHTQVGNYCPGGATPSTACPSKTTSLAGASALTDCKAEAGSYGPAGAAAASCPAGSYCPAGSTVAQACPSHKTSPASAMDVSQCTPEAGYSGEGDACPAGSFCPAGSAQPTSCGTGGQSAAGSTTHTDCTAAAGLSLSHGNAGGCVCARARA